MKITEHIEHVKDLQKGHGEWTDNMKNVRFSQAGGREVGTRQQWWYWVEYVNIN